MRCIDVLVAGGGGMGLGIFIGPCLERGLEALTRSWCERASPARQRRSAQAANAQQRAQDQERAKRG